MSHRSELQDENAQLPIDETHSGMVTEVREEQPENACPLIETILSGME